jgi:hypothetical protein
MDRSFKVRRIQSLALLFLLGLGTVAPVVPTAARPTLDYTSAPSTSPLFENVTTKAGVQAMDSLLAGSTIASEREGGFLNGGRGACVSDFDGDGDDDIYVNGPGKNQMFRNDGNFTFADVTSGSGTGDAGYGMGCAAGDLDNDGDEDMIATNWYSHFIIYRNDGNLTFTNMTGSSGVDDVGPQGGVMLGDFDNDGLLDFFIPEYNKVNDRVYRNSGSFKFTDQTVASRVRDQEYGFQAIGADYDRDGDLDIYVVNDIGNDTLWQNDGHFQFTDVSRTTGAQDPGAGMGGAWGDFDNDGDLDIYTTNLGRNGLWQNLGGSFADRSNSSGVDDAWIGWGTVWFDYDNDGQMDVYVANGVLGPTYAWNQPSKLFHNLGNQTFADVSQGSGVENGEVARGAAVGDFDQDGRIDLYVLNINCPAMLFQNVVNNTNAWLRVKLESTVSNRDGVGATISVHHGSEQQTQVVAAGSSYLSSNSRVLNFGLGEATLVDQVVVRWPSGLRQVVSNVSVNQTILVKETDERDPIAVAPDVMTKQGEAFTLNGSESSDNVRVASWTWTVNVNGTNKTASGEVAPMTIYTSGDFQGRLEVRDPFGRVGVALFRVSVQPYLAVRVDIGPDLAVREGANVTFIATGNSSSTPDFYSDCLFEWWLESRVGRVNLSGPRPTFVFTATGIYTVSVRVMDPLGTVGTDSLNLTVLDGTLPVVSATVPSVVDEDAVVQLDASASSDNDPTFPATATFYWNYTGPNGPVSWSGSMVSATFWDPGVFTLSLSVSDQVGNTVVQVYTVTVRDVTRPIPDAGPDRATLPGRDLAFTASLATDNDPTFQQTGQFEWTLHLRSGPVVLTGQSVVYSFAEPGTFQVDLDAWDAGGNHAAAVDTAAVVVQDIVAPSPNGGGDRIVGVLESFDLNASGTTDNDPTVLATGTFVWEFQDGSTRVALAGVSAHYTFVRAGIYTVRLTVRDAGDNAAAVTFKVTSADLDAPLIQVNQSITELFPGTPLSLNATGSRDNVGITSFSWRVQGPFAFDAQLYGLVASVTLERTGNYTVVATARDAAGNGANLSFSIRVVPRPIEGPGTNGSANGTGNGTPPDGGTPPSSEPPRGPSTPALEVPALVCALVAGALLLRSDRRSK